VAAYTRPGWMTRGFWPTLVESIGDMFQAPQPLIAPFENAFPDIDFFAEAGITENYMVGGWVPAAEVPALLARVRDKRGDILAYLKENDWDDASSALEIQKLEEAVSDAALRKLPFCEATEIYSGFEGVIP